jgi:hypothetical protein
VLAGRHPSWRIRTDRFALLKCVIDGKVVAYEENGGPDFKMLRRPKPAPLHAFDLLELNGARAESSSGWMSGLFRATTLLAREGSPVFT